MKMTPEQWQRYIDNECTEEERKEIFYYLQSLSPQVLEEQITSHWEENPPAMPGEAARRMDSYISSMLEAGRPVHRKAARSWPYWAAACIAGLAIGIFLLWNPVSNRSSSLAETVLYRTFQNTGISVQKVTLPDSSAVWLTPHSQLQVPALYPAGGRNVLLEGEGYFEVMHNTAQPFVVRAGMVQTTVLGTHFNIEAYKGETDTRVSLSNGKVAVKIVQGDDRDSTLFLLPGNRLIYQPAQKRFFTESFSNENETDWKSGALVLDDLPVLAVLQRLGQRFGKSLQYDPAQFKGKRFTATYRRADFDLILQNIAFVQGFQYKVVADSVFIHSSQ